ncbi:MAG: Hsp20 family protein, partial [Thermodesulfobacteriota bacterium]
KPAVDILETPEEYIVRIDLPGVNKEEINIEIKRNCFQPQGDPPPCEPRGYRVELALRGDHLQEDHVAAAGAYQES